MLKSKSHKKRLKAIELFAGAGGMALGIQQSGVVTRNQLALAAGLSANSGTFGTYLSKLRSNHLIVEQGGYYQINPEL